MQKQIPRGNDRKKSKSNGECGGLAFEGEGDGVAAAEAEGGDAFVSVAALHLVEQGDEDAGAAGSDGMADGDGSAVDVDAVEGEAELFGDAEGLDAEGFVEFEEFDVVEGPVGAGENFLDSGDGSEHDPAGSDAAGGLRADGGEGLEVEVAGAVGGHEDDGCGCVVDTGRVAGGDGAVCLKAGLRAARASREASARTLSSWVKRVGGAPFLVVKVRGMISASKRPACCAAEALRWELSA